MTRRRAGAALIALVALLLSGAFSAVPAADTPQNVVLSLPGGLDNVPVLNSNSPEVVQTEGILVSTLPKAGTAFPQAHLNYSFSGRFDVFAHHIARADNGDLKTLYLGVLLSNPSKHPVIVDVLAAASYDSQPDAPFIELPAQVDNPNGTVYAGPGDRVTDEILRVKRDALFPAAIIVPPHKVAVLANLPIAVKGLQPPLNGRSLFCRLYAHGSVYAATLAMFARQTTAGAELVPTLNEWQELWKNGALAGPREKAPSAPDSAESIVYGRVAGVAIGSRWDALLTNPAGQGKRFVLDRDSVLVSYPVASSEGSTLGTGQVQSAPLIAREPGTAYAAHGNYAIEYDLVLPLFNAASFPRMVSIALQTPLKTKGTADGLSFSPQPDKAVFFRGTVRINYIDDCAVAQEHYVHIVQHRGERGEPLLRLLLAPKAARHVELRFLYPPDSTPPQAVTVSSPKS